MEREILKNIRLLREKRGLSQENVAEEIGINQSTYAKIESGKMKLNVSMLNEIAKALEVPPGFFWDEKAFDKISSDPNTPAKQLRTIREEVDKNLELINSINTTADWYIQDLYKHVRLANFKPGDIAEYELGMVVKILTVAYSDILKAFVYKVAQGSNEEMMVPEFHLKRIPKGTTPI